MELLNSRKTIFELLKDRGYDITKYDIFSSGELDLLNENNQLDLNIQNDDGTKQIIIKYLNKKISKNTFLKTVYNEFDKIDNKDIYSEIIFIMNTTDPVGPELLNTNRKLGEDYDYEYINGLQDICNKYFDSTSKYSQIFHIKHLAINITKHENVPKFILMNSEEEKKILDDYKITKNKLPCILRNDPISKYYGLKINNIVKIIRNNNSIFYRRCK